MAMTPCILPAVGKPGFELAGNEIEIGMGIHGEPGVERTAVKTAKETARILLDKILADYDYSGSEAALLINGLGATPLMELYILSKEIHEKGTFSNGSKVTAFSLIISITGPQSGRAVCVNVRWYRRIQSCPL